MAELTYKPNGSSSPDRKQNVYIACHPKDIVLLDDIANDIYRYQNCAIWYDSKPLDAFDEGDYLNQLKEKMQLFVVPITTRFLLENNRARDLELGFALRNNIPVLPLMLESDLEKLYQEHCGDLQFLDKTSHDLTAISYDQKLKKYLSSVLIGDELAEKIRKAFDAYVFLSYRKKDREYAHKLMRLIHKNEFARDIAIWYDEYLVPGEGFNDAIKQALKNSKLFAMVVTPNLVNETNYVMQEEYPIAKAEGKPIIPVEMEPTERSALEEIDCDFPSCVAEENESDLSEVFQNHISAQKIATRERDQDPEHNFFIGLAYLNGIDVEIDRERATELITSAAEADLVEAIDKLVEMYRSGQGVERDYETALVWQERKVFLLENTYREDPSVQNLTPFLLALIDCGDYYDELKKMDKINAINNQLYMIAEAACIKNRTSETLQFLAIAHDRLGRWTEETMERRRNSVYDGRSLAIQDYKKSAKLRTEIFELYPTSAAAYELAHSYRQLGWTLLSLRKYSEALSWFEKSLKYAKYTDESGTEIAQMYALLDTYRALAAVHVKQKDYAKSLEYSTQCLTLCEALSSEVRSLESKKNLLLIYEDLCELCYRKGDYNTAFHWHEQAISIAQELILQRNFPEDKFHLASGYDAISVIHKKGGDMTRALEATQRAISIHIELASNVGIQRYLRQFAASYMWLEHYFPGEISEEVTRVHKEKITCKTKQVIASENTKEFDIFADILKNSIELIGCKSECFAEVLYEQYIMLEEYIYKCGHRETLEAGENSSGISSCLEDRLLSLQDALGECFFKHKSFKKALHMYQQCIDICLTNTQKYDVRIARCYWAISRIYHLMHNELLSKKYRLRFFLTIRKGMFGCTVYSEDGQHEVDVRTFNKWNIKDPNGEIIEYDYLDKIRLKQSEYVVLLPSCNTSRRNKEPSSFAILIMQAEKSNSALDNPNYIPVKDSQVWDEVVCMFKKIYAEEVTLFNLNG